MSRKLSPREIVIILDAVAPGKWPRRLRPPSSRFQYLAFEIVCYQGSSSTVLEEEVYHDIVQWDKTVQVGFTTWGAAGASSENSCVGRKFRSMQPKWEIWGVACSRGRKGASEERGFRTDDL